MTSKAEKKRKHKHTMSIRARGGRPPLTGVERQPNGQPSRKRSAVAERTAMSEAEAKSVAIAARVQRTGLPPELCDLAAGPNAGTIHGVLRLKKQISADQWAAADWFIRLHAAWLRAIEAPGRPIEPSPEKAKEFDEEAYAAWCKHTARRWREAMLVIRDAAVLARAPVKAALDELLLKQQDLPHMVPWLKVGLTAIHKAFLTGRGRISH